MYLSKSKKQTIKELVYLSNNLTEWQNGTTSFYCISRVVSHGIEFKPAQIDLYDDTIKCLQCMIQLATTDLHRLIEDELTDGFKEDLQGKMGDQHLKIFTELLNSNFFKYTHLDIKMEFIPKNLDRELLDRLVQQIEFNKSNLHTYQN